jgi:hypothetical protein
MEVCGHAAFPGFCTSKKACSKDPVVSLDVQRSETYSGSCRSCTREVCMVAGMLEGNGVGIANAPQATVFVQVGEVSRVTHRGKYIFCRVLTCLDLIYTRIVTLFSVLVRPNTSRW